MTDAINPSHYQQHPSGLQIIEMTRHMPFSLGNAFKYIARAMHKHDSPLEDLKKAQWYLEDYATNFTERLPTNINKMLWDKAVIAVNTKRHDFFYHELDQSVLYDIYKMAFEHHVHTDTQKALFKLHQMVRQVS